MFGGCLVLGVFSKENAILLCLYALLLEWTLFSNYTQNKLFRAWKILFLISPLTLLIIVLIPKVLPYLNVPYPYRTFSATERLFTEFRVVSDYIFSIIIPRPQSFGLFHYNYEISRSIITPLSTIYSALFLGMSTILGIYLRKAYPLIAFGILFFFASHILESTVVNLELVFDHRNYLGLFGLIFAASLTIRIVLRNLIDKEYSIGIYALIIGIISWLALTTTITYKEVQLWKNPMRQLATWASEKPLDNRAQGYYAMLLTKHGRFDEAEDLYRTNFDDLKDDISIPLLWIELKCHTQDVSPPTIDTILSRIPDSLYHHAALTTLDAIAIKMGRNECHDLAPADLVKILENLLASKNYQYSMTKKKLLIVLSKFHVLNSNIAAAVNALEKALIIHESPDVYTALSTGYFLSNKIKSLEENQMKLHAYCQNHPISCFPFHDEINNYDTIVDALRNPVKYNNMP
jgi:tetratricopeptide (TPR) repeat protein